MDGRTKDLSGPIEGSRPGVRHADHGHFALIDGLRGVAALVVITYHYIHFFMPGQPGTKLKAASELMPLNGLVAPVYDYGLLAVQLFWLISGFVFTLVYADRPASTKGFAISRIARLYPLHLVTLFAVAALQAVALARYGHTLVYGRFDWQHFLPQLVMASNWSVHQGLSFNGPVWSVSIELLVYALFWLTRGIVARLGFVALAALVLGSYFAHQTVMLDTRLFDCAFYFFIGCALCRLHTGLPGQWLRLPGRIALPLAVGLYGIWLGSHWAALWLVIPGLSGALILALCTLEPRIGEGLRRRANWLGEASYGIYLWHFPLQLALILSLRPFVRIETVAQSVWFLLAYLLLVFVVARVSYSRFERPMRDFLKRRFGRLHWPAKGGDKLAAIP